MVASELVLVVPLIMEDDTLIEDYKSAIDAMRAELALANGY